MKIEKPNWQTLFNDTLYRYETNSLDKWFQEHVTPINTMLSEGVEVYGHDKNQWKRWQFHAGSDNGDTHKALLINIQPIKKESAEDILKDWYEDLCNERVDSLRDFNDKTMEFMKRAKEVLKLNKEASDGTKES